MDVLREIDADVIALQEVVSAEGRAEQDQARFIAAELGFNFCLGENRRLNGSPYGNLLLSRFPLHRIQNHDISVAERERRGCLRCDIQIGAMMLHIFNVHLGTSFFERRYQARKLVSPDILQQSGLYGIRVVLGDFNEWTPGLASRLLSTHFRSAEIGTRFRWSRTYPSVFPFLHLDHIYFDPALKMERLSLYRTPTALLASDHLPLVADLSLQFATSSTTELSVQ